VNEDLISRVKHLVAKYHVIDAESEKTGEGWDSVMHKHGLDGVTFAHALVELWDAVQIAPDGSVPKEGDRYLEPSDRRFLGCLIHTLKMEPPVFLGDIIPYARELRRIVDSRQVTRDEDPHP